MQSSKLKKKKKIGTILDNEVVKIIKKRSAQEGKSISAIIQEAILNYKELEQTNIGLRLEAANRFCSKPFNISFAELNNFLAADYFEQ